MIWLFLVGMGLDVATFAVMMLIGGMGLEANPVVHGLYGVGGYPLVLATKAVVIAYFLVAARVQRYRAARYVMFSVGILVGMIGALSNVLTIRAVV